MLIALTDIHVHRMHLKANIVKETLTAYLTTELERSLSLCPTVNKLLRFSFSVSKVSYGGVSEP